MSDNKPLFRLRRLTPDKPTQKPRHQDPVPDSSSALGAQAKTRTPAKEKTKNKRRGKGKAKAKTEPPKTTTPTPPPPGTLVPEATEGVPSEPTSHATGGLFTSPAGVLSFLAGVAGARLADEATCRRGPEDQWWADIELPWETAAPFIRTAGGRPFEHYGERWLEVPILGAPSTDTRQAASLLQVDAWSTVDLGDLLATLPLRRGRVVTGSSVDVVVSGALGRWVLRRATALGLRVRMATASCRPLRAEGSESGVLLIRLESEGTTVPRSLVQALSSLPYTVVGQAVGAGSTEGGAAEGRLLIDARYRPPLVETLLAPMIPAGEVWLLAGPDIGHWRLTLTGQWVDGAELLSAPPVSVVDASASPPASLPDPVDVRLIPRPGALGPTDAVLLDDDELRWLQSFLRTRPIGERVFLLPGGERHLLTAPGGLGAVLPFGLPLTRSGPGGLYIESGTGFFPALPSGARREIFGLDDASVVVVTADGNAFRFERERLVPAWSLWVGDVPETRSKLSPSSRDLIARIAALLQSERPTMPPPDATRLPPVESEDPSQLLREAQQAELRGDLTTAAQLLEKAGHLGPAGRLYERAASAS